jgi:hypothetical protein
VGKGSHARQAWNSAYQNAVPEFIQASECASRQRWDRQWSSAAGAFSWTLADGESYPPRGLQDESPDSDIQE